LSDREDSYEEIIRDLTAHLKEVRISNLAVLENITIIAYYYYVLLRHNGSKTDSSVLTQTRNTTTRKTQKDKKNSNQQSYQQTDKTGCSGKAVGRRKRADESCR